MTPRILLCLSAACMVLALVCGLTITTRDGFSTWLAGYPVHKRVWGWPRVAGAFLAAALFLASFAGALALWGSP